MTKISLMVSWSFELYSYLQQTVPQVSDCCLLGLLVGEQYRLRKDFMGAQADLNLH